MCIKVEAWLLGCAEMLVVRLAQRQWISRSNAAKRLSVIDARLARITRRRGY